MMRILVSLVAVVTLFFVTDIAYADSKDITREVAGDKFGLNNIKIAITYPESWKFKERLDKFLISLSYIHTGDEPSVINISILAEKIKTTRKIDINYHDELLKSFYSEMQKSINKGKSSFDAFMPSWQVNKKVYYSKISNLKCVIVESEVYDDEFEISDFKIYVIFIGDLRVFITTNFVFDKNLSINNKENVKNILLNKLSYVIDSIKIKY